MKTARSMMIRQAIMFWITVPVLITIVLATFIEITGRFFKGDVFGNAAGILFLSGFVPIFAAHFAFLSAIAGVIGLFFGLQLDRKFFMSLLIGLAFGVFMLHGIYLS